jgi:echinoderm microtubule-associated protein-like 6
LKSAHGFRAHDAIGTLKYAGNTGNSNATSRGKVVYTTAALAVIQDTGNDRSQEFFDLHQDDVVSLALHPGGEIAATGSRAPAGKAKMVDILIWSVSSREVLARLTGFHRRAVSVLQFSPDGQKLLSIG